MTANGKWCGVGIKPVPLHGSEQNGVSDLTMSPDFAGSHLSDGLWQITDKNVEDGSSVWPVCHKVCFQDMAFHRVD